MGKNNNHSNEVSGKSNSKDTDNMSKPTKVTISPADVALAEKHMKAALDENDESPDTALRAGWNHMTTSRGWK